MASNILLRRSPPKTKIPPTPEMRMWWAVMQTAAKDLRFAHESAALDAYEFLETTGKWMAMTWFSLSPAQYDDALRNLASRRSGALRISLLRL